MNVKKTTMTCENLLKHYQTEIVTYPKLPLLDAAFKLLTRDHHLTGLLTNHLTQEQRNEFQRKRHPVYGFAADRLRKTHPWASTRNRMNSLEKSNKLRKSAFRLFSYTDSNNNYFNDVDRAVANAKKLYPEFSDNVFGILSNELMFAYR